MSEIIRIGTRGSKLALWQAHYVADLIRQQYEDVTVDLKIFTTRGDKILDKSLPEIGGKGLFTEELETSLRNGDIDCAVHSLKDLPTEKVDGIYLGAIPERGNPTDALVARSKQKLAELPQGAVVGTSSLRRQAQLLYHRPDLKIIDIRGNVPTRVQKLMADDSPYDAIVLASAGLERLEMAEHITETLETPIMLNAPAQGAVGIQCREEPDSMSLFAPLMHLQTWLAVTAERAFLSALGGGCSLPVAAHAHIEKSILYLHGRVTAVDGSTQVDVNSKIGLIRESNIVASANRLGGDMAQKALEQGANAILEALQV
jgi:hydroxymethylbilane synthase